VGCHADDIQDNRIFWLVFSFQELLRDYCGSEDVGLEAGEPLLQVLIYEWPVICEYARVIDEDIWGTEAGKYGGNGIGIRDIGGECDEFCVWEFAAERMLGALDCGFVSSE